MHALTDAELQELDDYLDGNAEGEASNLEMLDGLLSAAAVAPRMLQPSLWLPLALGRGERLPDLEAAQRTIGLIMRLYNEIVARVGRPLPPEGQDFDVADLPLIAIPVDEELSPEATEPPIGAAWALGFWIGRELDSDAWGQLCDDWEGLGEDLEEISRLLEGLEPGGAGPSLPMSERFEILSAVPELLHDLYAARELPEAPEPVRRGEPKVGRNDACPCGSGLKYKKCHGAN